MIVILFFTFCNNNRYYLCEYFLLVQDQKERATMTKRINKVIVKKDSSLAISQLRKEKGITQAELADVLGISVAAVSLYEQGIRFPSKEMAQKICDYFNCDMNYLYGLSPIKNSLLQTNLKGRDIAVYDRRRLVDDGAGLSKTNKAIFDIEYTVSTITLPVSVALKDKAYFEQTKAAIIATREETARRLTALGFTVLPSAANFLFVSHPGVPAEELFAALREKHIFVRYFKKPRIENFLRITIGTPEEMERFLEETELYVREKNAV